MLKSILLTAVLLFALAIPPTANTTACDTVSGTVMILGGAPSGWTPDGPLASWPVVIEKYDEGVWHFIGAYNTESNGYYIINLTGFVTGLYRVYPHTQSGTTFWGILDRKPYLYNMPDPSCPNVSGIDFTYDFVYY